MLSIKQLNKTYANGVKCINNVSLDIPNGMFGLLGPNGAGQVLVDAHHCHLAGSR